MLHILNGDSSLHLFEESGLPGEAHVFADVLHGGRLLPDPTDTAFVSERIGHVVQMGFPPDRAAALHADWCRGLDSAGQHDEVVLWFEHDLFDQLLLVHHIEFLSRAGVLENGTTTVSLVCIGEFEGIPDFAGLGQLSPAQFASLFPRRSILDDAQIETGRRAWHAITGPDPRAIETVARGGTSALPFLEGALVRLLEEYPRLDSGLSRAEAQAVRAIAEGANTPRAAFRAQAAMEERIYLGDSSFWSVLLDLAAAGQPLLEMDVGEVVEEGPALPEGTVSLTPFGRDVNAGHADHAAVNGIDRWVGGVHLCGRTPRWRWDAAARRIEGPFEEG